MSDALSIATVTAVLAARVRALLDAAGLSEADVVTGHPGANADAGVYLHCYQVMPNGDLRNATMPERDGGGQVRQRPQLPVDLHYLLSFVGDVSTQEPELLAGRVMTDWHRAPLLTPPEINEFVASLEAGHGLAGTDLADQEVGIRLTPLGLDLEDMSRLWGMLGRDAHHLSVAYRVETVVLEADAVVGQPLPVTAPQLSVFAFGRPRLDRVRSDVGDQPVVPFGQTLVVQGQGLRGDRTVVRLGGARLPIDDATPGEVRQAFDAASGLVAGVVAVQVVHEVALAGGETREAAASNTLPVVLAPTITAPIGAVAGQTGAGETLRRFHTVTVPLSPVPTVDQHVEVLLTAGSQRVSAVATVAGATVAARFEPRLAAATWWVRVSVDGATSPMATDGAGHIVGPQVVVA